LHPPVVLVRSAGTWVHTAIAGAISASKPSRDIRFAAGIPGDVIMTANRWRA
jgi:hypothetical protein